VDDGLQISETLCAVGKVNELLFVSKKITGSFERKPVVMSDQMVNLTPTNFTQWVQANGFVYICDLNMFNPRF